MIEIAEDNQKYGERFNVPVFITQGKNDKIVSVKRVEEFFNKIATPADLKEMKLYETEHYVLSDGLIIDEAVQDQIDWLNKLF